MTLNSKKPIIWLVCPTGYLSVFLTVCLKTLDDASLTPRFHSNSYSPERVEEEDSERESEYIGDEEDHDDEYGEDGVDGKEEKGEGDENDEDYGDTNDEDVGGNNFHVNGNVNNSNNNNKNNNNNNNNSNSNSNSKNNNSNSNNNNSSIRGFQTLDHGWHFPDFV